MAKEAASGDRSVGTLYWQLRLLARDRGIRRKAINTLLDNELRDLRNYWRVDTKQECDEIGESLKRELERHLPKIPPQPDRRKIWNGRQRAPFEHVYRAVFNALDADRGILETRLARAGVSKSAAQRDLDYACEQIEQQILATGFVAQMPIPDVPDDPKEELKPPVKPRRVYTPEIVARALVPRAPQTVTVRRVDVPDRQPIRPNDSSGAGTSERDAGRPLPKGDRTRSRRRRTRYKIAVIMAFIVLLGSGIAAFELLSDSNTQEPRPTENPLGDALKVDLQEVRSSGLSGIAFADDHQGDAQRLLALAETGGIAPETYNGALESGAYLVGGATLRLKLSQKRAGQDVDLFKVRVIKKTMPLATYSAFRDVGLDWPRQSPDDTFPEHAGVLLDAGTEAHRIDSGGNLLEPYLQEQGRVPVTDRASPQLLFDVQARERAYEFQVELEYSVNGQKFSQLVDLHGQPFRVTADLCITRQLSYKLSAPVIDTLSGMHYKVVALPDRRAGAASGTYTTESPDSFAEACRAH